MSYQPHCYPIFFSLYLIPAIEKYKGEAILQKTYCADFLTKRMVVNQGEVPKWYVQESHPAIISIEDFDVVQLELARRKQMKQQYSSKGLFASKLFCADCGGIYGSKVWHSNDPYRCIIWQCNHKYDKKGDMESRCKTPHLKEDAVRAMFAKACEHMVANRSHILKRQEAVIRMLTDCTELDAAIVAEQSELEVVTKLIRDFIKVLAARAVPKEEADARKNALQDRFNKVSDHLNALKAEREERLARSNEIRRFVRTFRENSGDNWNIDKWMFLLEKATVQRDGAIDFTFKDGTEIRVEGE